MRADHSRFAVILKIRFSEAHSESLIRSKSVRDPHKLEASRAPEAEEEQQRAVNIIIITKYPPVEEFFHSTTEKR